VLKDRITLSALKKPGLSTDLLERFAIFGKVSTILNVLIFKSSVGGKEGTD
jgi:hypothetical protein